MKKKAETNWNELWPVVNILNEVCHGIGTNYAELGCKYEDVFALLRKIAAYEAEEDKSEDAIFLELTDREIEILKMCFEEVFKQIEEWEFSIRVGIPKTEAINTKEKLTN